MKLEISEEHLRIIAQALGNMPYSAAAPVLAELQKQVDAANAPKPEKAKARTKPEIVKNAG